jgi:glycosyltransferase involved in cell wall biosynthesis
MTLHQLPSVVVVHERYQQPGGEDVAVDADCALLEGHGHRVSLFERHNDEIKDMGPLGRVQLAAGTVWSGSSRRALGDRLDRFRPDVVHVHNTLPLLSPSIYRAASERGIPVVQTIHNYRLVCASGSLLREGRACDDCVGHRLSLPAVRYACFRSSRAQTAVVAAMQATHRTLRTWDRHVDLYLPVSEHVLRRLVEAGAIPRDRAMVRRNHVSPDPGARRPGSDRGCAVFVGRLSHEKGVDVLIRAAAQVPELCVRIVGDGPERARLGELARQLQAANVSFLGRLPRSGVFDELRGARCLALPSTWEEPMGVVLIEAAALGVPVIGSNTGGTPEAIVRGTGVLVPPGDVAALAAALRDAASDPEGWWRRGVAARRQFEAEFSPARAYETLMMAYGRIGLGARPPQRVELRPAQG